MWLSEQNVSQAEGIEHANVFFLKHFIKLFMRDTERGSHKQREKQASCGKPDM